MSPQIPALPRSVNSQAAKHYHAIGKAYEALAESFKEKDLTRLYATAEAGQGIWYGVSQSIPSFGCHF